MAFTDLHEIPDMFAGLNGVFETEPTGWGIVAPRDEVTRRDRMAWVRKTPAWAAQRADRAAYERERRARRPGHSAALLAASRAARAAAGKPVSHGDRAGQRAREAARRKALRAGPEGDAYRAKERARRAASRAKGGV